MLACTAGALELTTCGQAVPRGEVGTLRGDLDCSASAGAAVMLGMNAVLALNGFTLHAAPPLAVLCEDVRCAVEGPGEITGGGIEADRGLRLTDVDIHDAPFAVKAYAGLLTMTNVTVSNVTGFDSAVVGSRVRATNVTVSGSREFGIYAVRSIRGTSVTVTGNGWSGVFGRRIVLDGLVAHGNGAGAYLTVYGAGVQSYRSASLANSVVTGNQFLGVPLDVLSVARPALVATSCEHSGRGDGSSGASLGTWGVCSLD